MPCSCMQPSTLQFYLDFSDMDLHAYTCLLFLWKISILFFLHYPSNNITVTLQKKATSDYCTELSNVECGIFQHDLRSP